MDLLERYNQGIEPWKLLEEKLAVWHLQEQTCLQCSLCGVLKAGLSGAERAKERL